MLIGDDPNRSLCEHLNSYTGGDSSNSVSRLLAAHLNAQRVLLSPQVSPTGGIS